MAQNNLLSDYLSGTVGEGQARRSLAAEGPDIIAQLLVVHSGLLNIWGRLAATQPSSLEAEHHIDQAADRATDLVASVASVSTEHAMKTLAHLVYWMQHPDPRRRAHAVLLCMADGLPDDTWKPVVHCFLEDKEFLPRIAASFCMAAVDVPEQFVRPIASAASDWINSYAVPTYPRLYHRVQSEFKENGLRALAMGVGTVYREIARLKEHG